MGKLNSNGELQWFKALQQNASLSDAPRYIQELSNGDILVMCNSNQYINSSDASVVRFMKVSYCFINLVTPVAVFTKYTPALSALTST